ncbi:unnamed protein product [Protopolystoma xenopodis]|uniref:Uncharacterized protein n=1 Tax=Protopolystoma xenopodis TaxID=117903 RepID=A0A3S5APQ5_9PLAT|nr:unnamed protein product [Protopolystoma xenopodis]
MNAFLFVYLKPRIRHWPAHPARQNTSRLNSEGSGRPAALQTGTQKARIVSTTSRCPLEKLPCRLHVVGMAELIVSQ